MNANVTFLDPKRAEPLLALPASIEAEQNLIGAMLINPETIGIISSIVAPEHFSEDVHRRIVTVAVGLVEQRKPVTIGTLMTYLGDTEIAPGITPNQYLARLAAQAIPPILAPDMAREIRDIAAKRDLIAIGEDLIVRARTAGPSLGSVDIANEALTGLQTIAETAVAADTRRDAGACASVLINRARAVMRGELPDAGVSTGLPDLDRATGGGFQPGTLWIIAGRPRMGKTVMATGFALKVANKGLRELDAGKEGFGSQIFSLEVTEDQIIARMLADLAYNSRRPITFGNIMRGALDETDLWEVEVAQDRLSKLPLALDVASNLSVQEIAARIRSEKTRMARKNTRLAVVFLDYLKFIKASERYRGHRVYEIGEISAGLKQLAKTENVCIVLLAQVNRAVDNRDRKDRAPGLSDLRDSGDLEADTDVVCFIDRESVRIKQSAEYRAGADEAMRLFIEKQNQADLIVAKTRTGSENTLSIWFDAGASTFATSAR